MKNHIVYLTLTMNHFILV